MDLTAAIIHYPLKHNKFSSFRTWRNTHCQLHNAFTELITLLLKKETRMCQSLMLHHKTDHQQCISSSLSLVCIIIICVRYPLGIQFRSYKQGCNIRSFIQLLGSRNIIVVSTKTENEERRIVPFVTMMDEAGMNGKRTRRRR